jgi:hypothetical protein
MSEVQRWYLYGVDDFSGPYDAKCTKDDDGEWCYFGDVAYALDGKDAEITRLRELVAGQDDVGHRYSQASMDAVVGQLDCLREELERIAELDYTFDGAAFTAVCIARVALRGEEEA